MVLRKTEGYAASGRGKPLTPELDIHLPLKAPGLAEIVR